MSLAARVLRIAFGIVTVAWWLPTIVFAVASLAWRHVAFDLRMARVRRLRRAGRVGDARAALARLRRDLDPS